MLGGRRLELLVEVRGDVLQRQARQAPFYNRNGCNRALPHRLHRRQARGADGGIEAEDEREAERDAPRRRRGRPDSRRAPTGTSAKGPGRGPRRRPSRRRPRARRGRPASRRNWRRISLSEAPSDFRRPISYRRSEKEISMTERTPTPPTRRTVAASDRRTIRQPAHLVQELLVPLRGLGLEVLDLDVLDAVVGLLDAPDHEGRDLGEVALSRELDGDAA